MMPRPSSLRRPELAVDEHPTPRQLVAVDDQTPQRDAVGVEPGAERDADRRGAVGRLQDVDHGGGRGVENPAMGGGGGGGGRAPSGSSPGPPPGAGGGPAPAPEAPAPA